MQYHARDRPKGAAHRKGVIVFGDDVHHHTWFILPRQIVRGRTGPKDDRRVRANGLLSFGTLSSGRKATEEGARAHSTQGRGLDILITLVEPAGEVVTRKELISRFWPDVTVEEANFRR